jgi:two-component system chemotaxis response regulator CheB
LKAAGGTVVAQDEATAEYFGMPSAAIASGAVDMVLGLERIASAALEFVRPCPS